MLYLLYCACVLLMLCLSTPHIVDFLQWHNVIKNATHEDWFCGLMCALLVVLFLLPTILDVSWA